MRGRAGTYDRIGKAAVRYAFKYLRRRYKREIRIGFGIAAVAVAIAAYLASREVPEG
jgi:hypothetical protein